MPPELTDRKTLCNPPVWPYLPAMPSETTSPPASPAAAATPNLFLTVFPSIMLPMFMAAADQTIVATALPAIAGSLGDVERVSWVVVSYLVATTIAAPVYGKLGDTIGRKKMMFVALAVFTAASVLCALSNSILMLTAARVLQGAGSGGLMTLSQALIAEAVPPRQRGKYQGYLSGMYASASTFGPVAGGWLTQHYGWHSVFLVNVPLGALAAVLVTRLPVLARPGGSFRFDFMGTLFFAGFITPLLLAMEQAQHFNPRALPLALALVGLSALSLVLLIRQEKRARAPLLPIQLFRQPGIWRTDAMAAFVGGADGVAGDVPANVSASGQERGHRALRLSPAAADPRHRVRIALHRPDDRVHRTNRHPPLDRPAGHRRPAAGAGRLRAATWAT